MNQTQQAQHLAETYADAILRLSYAYLKNTHDAQDVCQTVFVKLLTEPREFESPEHERAYVLRMAANACKDLLKSPWRKRTCGLDTVLELPSPGQAGVDRGGGDAQDGADFRGLIPLVVKEVDHRPVVGRQGVHRRQDGPVLLRRGRELQHRVQAAGAFAPGAFSRSLQALAAIRRT